jgi:hypothetical protein
MDITPGTLLMNTILMRRVAIICLTSALFALGLLSLVQSHTHGTRFIQAGLNVTGCTEALSVTCSMR